MATKTVSVDEDAYARLMAAKRDRRESFSSVIKRAKWEAGARRCGNLLTRVSRRVPKKTLDMLDRAQATDAPPNDSWNP